MPIGNKVIYILIAVAGLFLLSCDRSADEDLAHRIIIADTHIDLPYQLKKGWQDLSVAAGGNFDYPRAKRGGLNLAFLAIYIPAESASERDNRLLADSLINLVEKIVAVWPDSFGLATKVEHVYEHFNAGKISLAMGMENASGLDGRLENIEYFYERGVRYITLAHSKSNRICDSSYDPERKWDGLSPFGREVVAEMNRTGMMIDVSHVTDSTFFQVLRLTRAPVIASHSSCRYFTPGYERNISDEMLKSLASNGGVIQINFGSSFINDRYRKNYEPMWDYLDQHHMSFGDPATAAYMKRYNEEHPVPFADVSEVADHIDHVIERVGIDHVGLGSDFDGLGDTLPTGLKDVSMYPNLLKILRDRGYSEEEVSKICSGNLLRVWQQVDQIARDLQQ